MAAAERYYRVMYYGSVESWNLRDQHMFDTLSGCWISMVPEQGRRGANGSCLNARRELVRSCRLSG